MKLATLVLLTAAGCFAQQKPWTQMVADRLPYFGSGNWIVVADSSFPLRSVPAIETILSDDSHIDTVRKLLEWLSKDGHVRPVLYADAELNHMSEQDAPGIGAYRQLLSGLLAKLFPEQPVKRMSHAAMMNVLNDAAEKTFNILIIKTNMALPYTSVYFELTPAQWPDDAEQRLRQSIQ